MTKLCELSASTRRLGATHGHVGALPNARVVPIRATARVLWESLALAMPPVRATDVGPTRCPMTLRPTRESLGSAMMAYAASTSATQTSMASAAVINALAAR